MNKGLMVAINNYPTSPLRGCVNDVTNMASFITGRKDAINDVQRVKGIEQGLGFNPEEIRLLVDDRATTEAIVRHLQWLVRGAKPGDKLLFHYSGHGAMFPIRDVNTGNIESNYCCICPVDFDWTKEHAILDIDFEEIFKDIPEGVSFTWISDSCHSGNLTREVYCSVEESEEYRVPRQFPAPEDILWRIYTALELGIEALGFAKTIERLEGAFISGCRADQTSADAYMNNQYCGALTSCLLSTLQEKHDGKPCYEVSSVETVVEETRKLLKKKNFSQIPQYHGTRVDRPFLS